MTAGPIASGAAGAAFRPAPRPNSRDKGVRMNNQLRQCAHAAGLRRRAGSSGRARTARRDRRPMTAIRTRPGAGGPGLRRLSGTGEGRMPPRSCAVLGETPIAAGLLSADPGAGEGDVGQPAGGAHRRLGGQFGRQPCRRAGRGRALGAADQLRRGGRGLGRRRQRRSRRRRHGLAGRDLRPFRPGPHRHQRRRGAHRRHRHRGRRGLFHRAAAGPSTCATTAPSATA